ncbi:hypothetical protein [Priestia megaterium]|uniref:hypothetical protein n=1 Tax=Priestia megaterium TaxID=1404 RepID=UPI002795EA34|nr:hypothetical protein [Priestia megaterium]
MIDELEENSKNAKRTVFVDLIKSIISAAVVIGVFSYLFGVETLYSTTVGILILIYLIYKSYKYYKELNGILNIHTHIENIEQRDNPKGELKKMINTHNMMLDRFKLKLDLLKSFSPIPIIVFISGLFVSSQFDTKLTPWVFSTVLSGKSLYTITMVMFVAWYIVTIRITWNNYEIMQFRNLQYQNAYDKINEK